MEYPDKLICTFRALVHTTLHGHTRSVAVKCLFMPFMIEIGGIVSRSESLDGVGGIGSASISKGPYMYRCRQTALICRELCLNQFTCVSQLGVNTLKAICFAWLLFECV